MTSALSIRRATPATPKATSPKCERRRPSASATRRPLRPRLRPSTSARRTCRPTPTSTLVRSGGPARDPSSEFDGLFASAVRALNIERARQLLAAPEASPDRSRAEADSEAETASPARQCPCCGGRMIIVETFEGARPARSRARTGMPRTTSAGCWAAIGWMGRMRVWRQTGARARFRIGTSTAVCPPQIERGTVRRKWTSCALFR